MFSWLWSLVTRRPTFRRFPDTFALTGDGMFRGLHDALQACCQRDETILLLSHFPSSLERLQQWLFDQRLDYEVLAEPVDGAWLARDWSRPQRSPIKLTLARMLSVQSTQEPLADRNRSVAFIIVERHPIIEHDRHIEDFARQLPYSTRLGYYLSLDDPLIRRWVNPQTIEILRMLGLDDNKLVMCQLITKRLEQVLSRATFKNENEKPADSLEQWLQLNDPVGTP